jgi:hypothetical protein
MIFVKFVVSLVSRLVSSKGIQNNRKEEINNKIHLLLATGYEIFPPRNFVSSCK